jgi:PKD repeat protein
MHTSRFFLKESIARRASRSEFSRLVPFILAVILMLTAMSCGGGATNNTGSPIANPGGPYLGNANQSLAFNGSGSSAPSGKTLTSFAWLFGDGASGSGVTTAHTYAVAGNYTATLTVTDSSGAINSSNVAVQIIPAPVARPGGPYSGKVGVAVSFNGSASTAPPGQLLGFTWNFGDGTTASGATSSHTYASAGTFTVSLTVTDDTAGTSTATTTATITAGPAPGGESGSPSTFFAIGPSANAASQYAFTLRSNPGSPSALSIETFDTTTGNLRETGLSVPTLDGNFAPSGMITDPSHKFLYLWGGNSVLTFSISSDTGALTPSGIIATNGSNNVADNQLLIFNPNGKFAFFIAQQPNGGDVTAPGSITRFSVDPNTGMLGAIETISAQVQNPQAAAVDPSGKYLYVSGLAANSPGGVASPAALIAVFGVVPNSGMMTPLSGSPLSVESGFIPTSLAVDSTGRFVYAAGANSDTNTAAISVFTINSSTGALIESSSPVPLGAAISSSTSIALSPSANFGYVLTVPSRDEASVNQSVQLFQWDAQTGRLESTNTVITNNAVTNASMPTAGSLVLFSPVQLNAADSATKPTEIILFFVSSPGAPVYANSINAATGSFSWVTESAGDAHH